MREPDHQGQELIFGVTLKAPEKCGFRLVKEVGAWSTLGAGAVAIRDVDSDVTAVGVPAAVVRCNSERRTLMQQNVSTAE